MSIETMDACDLMVRAYFVLLGAYFIYHVMDTTDFKATHGYRPLSYYGYMVATIVTAIATFYISWRL